MALIKPTIINTYGTPLVFEKAYYVVTHLSWDKKSNSITAKLDCYNNPQKERTIQASSYYTFDSDVSDPAANFVKQAYEFLKTLPEFEGAIDVLEEGQIT